MGTSMGCGTSAGCREQLHGLRDVQGVAAGSSVWQGGFACSQAGGEVVLLGVGRAKLCLGVA